MYEYYRRLNRSINDCYKCISCGSQTGSPSSSDLRTSALLTTKMTLFQSQTGSPSSSDSAGHAPRRGLQLRVSIPNGKPILFRLQLFALTSGTISKFQSQTGSPSSSDLYLFVMSFMFLRFNPKREAHPLQTQRERGSNDRRSSVSIPNGKPILFRLPHRRRALRQSRVSIPNGKPILFRRGSGRRRSKATSLCFNPKREAHPLQTEWLAERHSIDLEVSIPNGKPILFRHPAHDLS